MKRDVENSAGGAKLPAICGKSKYLPVVLPGDTNDVVEHYLERARCLAQLDLTLNAH